MECSSVNVIIDPCLLFNQNLKIYLIISKNLFLFKKIMAILLKIFLKKVDFFLAILTFFMAALDAQRNFMPTRYIFFSFYLFLIKSYSVFCQKIAKVEHTICDCN